MKSKLISKEMKIFKNSAEINKTENKKSIEKITKLQVASLKRSIKLTTSNQVN